MTCRAQPRSIEMWWLLAAAVYFRDPSGHMLEFLAMLGEQPRPELGIVSWAERGAPGQAY